MSNAKKVVGVGIVFDRLRAEETAREALRDFREKGLCDSEIIEDNVFKCFKVLGKDHKLISSVVMLASMAYEYKHKLYLTIQK